MITYTTITTTTTNNNNEEEINISYQTFKRVVQLSILRSLMAKPAGQAKIQRMSKNIQLYCTTHLNV